jgi:hypothetical protein
MSEVRNPSPDALLIRLLPALPASNFLTTYLLRQLIEQRLGGSEIAGLEAFGEYRESCS